MSQRGERPIVAIIDAKELRRASITKLFEPWARAEKLRLMSFTPDQAHEALQADTDVRMWIFSIGGASIAERQNLKQLKVLRALASKVPLVIISDRDDANDITAAFTAGAQGFINSGMPSALAFQTLSFILNGGSYFPPSAMHQLPARSEQAEPPVGRTEESKSEPKHNEQGTNGGGSAQSRSNLESHSVNLTARQHEVLDQLRLGESNKMIARRLGMTEGTVKVHIRQMMRKCQVANRTQLALGGSTVAKISEGDSQFMVEKSPEQERGSTAKPVSSTHQLSLIGTASRGRPRAFGNHH
jgi:DNA-binding NarL/FixJ family response regulator